MLPAMHCYGPPERLPSSNPVPEIFVGWRTLQILIYIVWDYGENGPDILGDQEFLDELPNLPVKCRADVVKPKQVLRLHFAGPFARDAIPFLDTIVGASE